MRFSSLKKWFLASLVAGAMNLCVSAGVVDFPPCAWSETKVVCNGGHVSVTDKSGKLILSFLTEGGNFGAHLVVSQAVDHLSIDARAAFAAGMRKLVFTSANFDPAPYRGKDCVLITEMGGARGAEGLAYFEGHGKRLHYYRSRKLQTKGHRKSYPFVTEVVENVDSLHLRWDVSKVVSDGVIEFYGAKYATEAELPVRADVKKFQPELIFHATFDDTAEAVRANGAKAPLKAQNLTYDEGKFGKAVRMATDEKSVLEYASEGNLVQERGTVSMWIKREWKDDGRNAKGHDIWRFLFANPYAKNCGRVGSGQLLFWCLGNRLRGDQSDDDDAYTSWRGGVSDDWNHVAMSWNETGVKLYINGKVKGAVSDSESPMVDALKARDLLTFNRAVFKSFFVGCCGNDRRFDGLIDDLRIYSSPLSNEQVRELYRRGSVIEMKATGCYGVADKPNTLKVTATSPGGCDLSGLKYCICDAGGKVVAQYRNAVGKKEAVLRVNLPAGKYELKATDGTWFYGSVPYVVMGRENPYVAANSKSAADCKCVFNPRDIELVQTLKLDREPGEDRFRAVGEVAKKSLNAVGYLEAGPNAGDRYAVKFNIDTNSPLWVFEIDYPDDALRTADVIIQRAKNIKADYVMQVGYAAGDEYPNTNKIKTHRVLYWAGEPEVALVVMTARTGAPAAVSAVRVYRVKNNALPEAEINEPEPPKAPTGIVRAIHDFKAFDKDKLDERQARMSKEAERSPWNRTVALYYEDPAIGYDFATGDSCGYQPDELNTMIDRTAALMKFTGENLFAYPGAWYHGLIDHDNYNPRRHAPDFLSAWYAKFDHEGLFIMPSVNLNTMPVPEGLITRHAMSDGSLHDTIVAIHDTGKPNWGGWHDTPPNFNFSHPKVRKHVSHVIGALTDQGVSHASFKGVCMHITRHCFLTFGDEKSGYNDYTVEAFAKAKGIKIPSELKKGALRGKAYAQWLRANAWNEWLDWRCDLVTDFYVKEAKKLAERRGDLKLWLNYMIPANINHPDFMKDDFMKSAWRAVGLDPVRITKEAPNVILGQTVVPADYRWCRANNFPSPEARAHQRVMDELPGFYENLKGAAYPLVHQHDRYWESPIGDTAKGGKNTLSCDWLNECPWRVTTINPSGVHVLRHFVEPLKYHDILGVSKGGFLIGTYGAEEYLTAFFKAFRALPGVVMSDLISEGDIRVRHCTFNGKSYFYVVNTGAKPATITLEMPPQTKNLVTREIFTGGITGSKATVKTLELHPYEMRSYVAGEGAPVLK